MSSPPFHVSLVNVVYTVDVGVTMNLENIFRNTKNCEYNPTRFAALKHRHRAGGDAPTFLIFPTGKIVCVGCKTPQRARDASIFLMTHLRNSCGLFLEDGTHTVRNLVSASRFPHEIDLVTLASIFPLRCMYEPEVFPGLTYKGGQHTEGATFLVFSSGKVVITGVQNEETLPKCVEHMRLISLLYKRHDKQLGK